MRTHTLFALLVLTCLCSVGTAADSTLIRDVAMVDVETGQLLEHRDILIVDGVIEGVDGHAEGPLQSGTRSIDGRGLFLMPGLIDSHVHLGGVPVEHGPDPREHPEMVRAAVAQEPLSYLMHGFTTLVQTGSPAELEQGWTTRSPRPDLVKCTTRSLAIAAAEAAPCIVISAQSDDLQRVISDAHSAGLRVILEADSLADWRAGVTARVDVIASGRWSWSGPGIETDLPNAVREVLDEVIERGIAVQISAQAHYGQLDLLEDPAYLSRPEVQQSVAAELLDWYRSSAAGVTVDRGAMRTAIDRLQRVTHYLATNDARFLLASGTRVSPAHPPGLNGYYELMRLRALGLTELQVLRAATMNNAEFFGLSDEVGRVEVGMRADLLLLGSNPLDDIQALSDIRMILHNGTWDTPAALSARHR